DKSFSHYIILRDHLRTHKGETPYQCSQCKMTFSRKIDLESHLITHTGKKQYQSSQCDKDFLQYDHIKSNTRTHTGKQPLQCSQRGKDFLYNIQLIRHMRVHIQENTEKLDANVEATHSEKQVLNFDDVGIIHSPKQEEFDDDVKIKVEDILDNTYLVNQKEFYKDVEVKLEYAY
ncbi:unnamed protein product, partial [Meganyctiphanes norvegica]